MEMWKQLCGLKREARLATCDKLQMRKRLRLPEARKLKTFSLKNEEVN